MGAALSQLQTDMDSMKEYIIDDLYINNSNSYLHLLNVKKALENVSDSRDDLVLYAYGKYAELYLSNMDDFLIRHRYVGLFGSNDPREIDVNNNMKDRLLYGLYCVSAGISFDLLFRFINNSTSVMPLYSEIFVLSGAALGFCLPGIADYIGKVFFNDGYDALCRYHDGLQRITDNLYYGISGLSIDASFRVISDG